MKNNNNKAVRTARMTLSALAIATAVAISLPGLSHASIDDPALSAPAVDLIEIDAQDGSKAAFVDHTQLISGGQRLWHDLSMGHLVFEAQLRNDLDLISNLEALSAQPDQGVIDTTLTALVEAFLGRHGHQSDSPQASAESLVAAIQAETLDQFLAASLAPLGPEAGLKRALARYNRVAANGGWSPINLKLAKDETVTAVDATYNQSLYNALQNRLMASGDWRGSTIASARVASSNLEFALKRFQTRHQLPVTGELDGKTISAMNVSVYRRIATLEVNLQRMRDNPMLANRDGVTVNIPAFKAEYVRNGETVWASDVIVGRDGRKTPLVESAINTVVMNPSWWVPRRIARDYILPKVKNKPNYIRSRGFQVLDGKGRPVNMSANNWKNVVATAQQNLRFRQLPGPNNALGEVKFLFPNRHSVYLHDTNSRHLFERVQRAFSSGCVRLAKPLELARVILEQEGYSADSVDAIDAHNKTQRINLENKVPVRTVYLTADVASDGSVHFYNDVYGRDGKLIAQLERKQG